MSSRRLCIRGGHFLGSSPHPLEPSLSRILAEHLSSKGRGPAVRYRRPDRVSHGSETTFVIATDGTVDTQSKAHRFAAEGLALHPDNVNERGLRALSFSPCRSWRLRNHPVTLPCLSAPAPARATQSSLRLSDRDMRVWLHDEKRLGF
jgi:hypothetical protein